MARRKSDLPQKVAVREMMLEYFKGMMPVSKAETMLISSCGI